AEDIKVSLTWDNGLTNPTFIDGSTHTAHLLIENPTSTNMIYYVSLGSDAWTPSPYWFLIWDPIPTPHYPITINAGGSILWENDITMGITAAGGYGINNVKIHAMKGAYIPGTNDLEWEVIINQAVIGTISVISSDPSNIITLGESPFAFNYTGVRVGIPEGLTNIGPSGSDIVDVIWGNMVNNQYTDFYDPTNGRGDLKEFITNDFYVFVHHGAVGTVWNLITDGVPPDGVSEFRNLYAIYA
ncbi:unnamed protein product, partial [marine sediment metagenome]